MKNSLFSLLLRALLLIMVVISFSQSCFAANTLDIPAPLKPWVGWVLYDQEEQLLCVPHYNNPQSIECNWPTELKVTLDNKGGEFRQSWHVHHEKRVSLPGNIHHWPQDVQVDGKPFIVIPGNNQPKIQLQTGTHTVTGRFTWSRLPEFLQIPGRSALVSLTVNNEQIAFPNIDATGRLWLKTVAKEEKIENRLQIESYKLIDDGIPPQVLVYVTLDVAGSAREITLGPLYAPEKFIPISLQSTLPAKLEQDARMHIQVRPGRYHFTLTMRHTEPLQTLSFDHPNDGLWPQQEIWSFRSRSDLRIVEIEGAPSIDPLQTSAPQEWQTYPAYRLLPGDTMRFKEIKRGDPQPAPDQMTLERTLWLRFDGSGYTVQDIIGGKKNTNWRLEMDPEIKLGRVAVDGVEQFITHRQGSDNAGIELREGLLKLMADSTYQGNIAALPATGWDHDFQQVKGRLHLPPGWQLLSANGFDNISHPWINRWTLLDFFIVLIFTVAVAKLFSHQLAGISFITLVLTYHEPDAPCYVWLALLIGFALLKHVPAGKFRQAVKVYQLIASLALVCIVIPYSIQALRIGMYPQMAMPWTSMAEYSLHQKSSTFPGQMADDGITLSQYAETSQNADMMLEKRMSSQAPAAEGISAPGSFYRSQVMQYDPKTLTQTGPGLPKWQPFETIDFSWSGPVTRDQTVSFVLIGPKTNLVLSFTRVFFIILLILGMFVIGYRRGQGFHFPSIKTLLFFPFLLLVLGNPAQSHADEIPSPEILQELQDRLLEKNDCFPACADISDVSIDITPDKLIIAAKVDAQIDTAIPLPSQFDHWMPQQVMVGGKSAKGLFRAADGLWALIPAGKHTVELSGKIRQQNTLQLPFPLKPHHAQITTNGWSVEGVHPDGSFDSQLQFKRIAEPDNRQTEILDTGVLPSFALVERSVLLGLNWQVATTVQRLSPPGSAMVLHIPLLPGESVTTEGVRVNKGFVQINLHASQTSFKWKSFLAPADTIILKHFETKDWTEIWKVDVSPVFHMEYEGIPVILHKTGNRWYPTWHPWPGEQVLLKISRPEGINGQTMTIERSHLVLRPGQRTTDARLNLSVKSSQGGQHTIALPPDAELQEVKIAGVIQPIRQEGRKISLPLTPGAQILELQWREPAGITTRYTTSEIDLGTPSVNASVDVYLPNNRWPLFMGGDQLVGPAVLFWSVLFVIVLVAFGLSKTGLTPLQFHQWFLLGIGMSMSNLAACFIVVGWLIALDLRKKTPSFEKNHFNLLQIGIAALTLLAMGSLVFAISNGLLGHPDMNISGNGSGRGLLRWYQDISGNILPQAWVLSIPMLTYRLAMLAWALWISFWLVWILKWGWKQFTEPMIWYSSVPGPKDRQKISEPETIDPAAEE